MNGLLLKQIKHVLSKNDSLTLSKPALLLCVEQCSEAADCENSYWLKIITIFRNIPPSQMFVWVLNTLLDKFWLAAIFFLNIVKKPGLRFLKIVLIKK